jgi:PAS domain S-box-containing protein
MERILLFLEDPEARRRLQELLAGHHEVAAAGGAALTEPCDLAIVDLSHLTRMRDPLRARKQAEEPVRFPVLLAALAQELEPAAAELGQTVDEIILLPVEPRELRLRVGNLLQLRRLSRELEARPEEPRRDAAGNLTGFTGVPEDITEKKRLEEEVQRMASFPQMNPNPVLEVDLSGRITFHNEATVKTLEKLGLSEITDFLPPDLAEILNAAAKGKENYLYREIKRGDALFGQVITYVEPFKVLRLYAMDITPRLRAEEAERRAKEEWERTFDAVPDLIAILDQNHQVIRCNRAMARVLGLEPAKLVGRPCYEAVHGLTEPPPFCPHSQLLQDGREHTAEVHELDRDFLVTASPLTDEQGRVVGSVHVARDITERKRAEEALRRQAELLDLAHDAIIVRDLKDRIIFWNQGAEENYGWGREEAAGKVCHLLLKTEFPRPLKEIEEELVATGRWEGELVHHTKDGRPLVAASRWALSRGEPARPARILQICTDITARKQAEVELQSAHNELERRVEERTADLKRTVEQLQNEIVERQLAEEQAESIGRLYRLLSQVNEAIVRAPDQETLFKQICRIAVEEGLFRMAWVGLIDPSGRQVRAVTQYGFDEGYLETLVIPLADVPQSRGPTGIAVREGRFDVCNDFAAEPRMAPWRERALARGYRSSGAFPLRVGGKVVGALTLYAERPGFFNQEEIALLESLASDLSFAMESMDREARRRQAEEARSQLIAILDATPDFVGTADATGQALYLNRAARKILGVGADEDISQVKIGDNHPPWAADLVLHEGLPTAAREGLWQGETVMLGGKGREIPLSQVILAHKDPQGQVKFYSTIGRDISDLKRAEEALEAQRQRLFAVLERIPAYVVLLAPDYTIPYANREFVRRFGDPGPRLCYEFLFGLETPCENCKAMEVFQTQTLEIWEWDGPDGNTYQIYDYPFTDVDGSPLVLELGVDISAHKQAKEALQESEKKLRFLAAQILRVQEQERGRLSRELHDGLGQALLVFKLQLRAIQRKMPAECLELRREANSALQYIDGIIEDIRRLSHNLSPSILEDLGLAAAIKTLCEEFKRLHDLEVLMDLDEVEGLLPRESQINIYRIFQEALANISKHAKANRVQLAVKKKDGEIAFAIADDGAGFNVEAVRARDAAERGLGLAAMDERVRILGGTLTISSKGGEGTRITFTVSVGRGR